MEIGVEPTARHAADLGIIPVVIEDACGAGHADAGATLLSGVALCWRRHHDRYRSLLCRARPSRGPGMIPKTTPSGLTRGWRPVFGKDHAQNKG
jgi:hypothetical protein